jgi:sigma-B regulation protein RsbU (phosphoserine phosphatase)
MDERLLTRIRDGLATKRDALLHWAGRARPQELLDTLGPAGEDPFRRHLSVIETALKETEDQTLGICTVCHEPVEAQLVQMDYTSCVCLDHLSGDERRSLEADLELAAAVQRSLLPQRTPEFPGLEIAAFSRPAQIVGGDYFDFFALADGRHGVAVSDVVGHGLSSSLIMASLQTMLRTLTQEHASPAELVARINRLCLHNIQFTTFITMFLGAFDPVTRELTFCNAGHNPPLLRRADHLSRAGTEWLRPTGAAVGIAEESIYRNERIALERGDFLLLYTDGLTETAAPGGELFGAGRLTSLVAAHPPHSAQDLIQTVRSGVEAFAQGALPTDDLTLVAIRVTA